MITAIDSLISSSIEPGGPGVAVAIAQNGVSIHAQGYGLANLEWQSPITSKTVFRLASLTKPFTSSAILLLEQQGKLRLNDPITTYLPDYPMPGETITIEHLLTHTSGLKNYSDLPDLTESWYRTDHSPQEMCDLFAHVPLEFTPGTRFSYSNSGYALLGLMIETITGMSYEAFIYQNIFAPLEMTHSYYMKPETIIPQRAAGYMRTNDSYQYAPLSSITTAYASGGLGSSLDDLLRWDHAWRTSRLFNQETQERITTPFTLASGESSTYGFGWFVERMMEQRVAYHPGGAKGFSTLMVRFLDHPITLIVLANQSNYDVESLAMKIGNALLS